MEKLIKAIEKLEKYDLVAPRKFFEINLKFEKKSKDWILTIYNEEFYGETVEVAEKKAIESIEKTIKNIKDNDLYLEDFGGVA